MSSGGAGEALDDLRDDLDELAFLARGYRARLTALLAELEAGGAHVRPATLDLVREQARLARARSGELARRILAARQAAASPPDDPIELVHDLTAEKAAFADVLRAQAAVVAGLAVATEWQSPSFAHSTVSAAGRGAGRIRAHVNDYKRDRHLDADAYERAYLEAMVDAPHGLRALLTSCGMAAFTTILGYLLLERKLERPVLVGRALYHECKQLLLRAIPELVVEIDEGDAEALLRACDLHPSAIFLDSLCNTRRMPLPDVPSLVRRLRGRPGRETYLVVDNTGLSSTFQLFSPADEARGVRPIVFESLLKYAQLGLDRAGAGIIVARRDDGEALDGYREHLGTNVSDAAVQALPPPDRRVLERRLARLGRNATALAERLEAELARSRGECPFEIAYPGLPSHPAYARAHRLPFRGGTFSIAVRDGREVELGRRLVESAIGEARRRGVPLAAGSSFGFDTTRIYLTAACTDYGEPFVRVAAGTEHRLQLDALADVLATALRRVGAVARVPRLLSPGAGHAAPRGERARGATR